MRKSPDYILFFLTILLIGIGTSIIYSASADIAYKKFGDELYFLKRQIVGSIISIILIIITSYINANIYQKFASFFLIVSFILCILVFIPKIGMSLQSGADVHRWLNFRFFMFQPSELVKIALVINLASILTKKQDKIKNFFTGFAWPLSIVILFFTLILLQPDFTTAVFIVVISFVMFYISGVSLKHLSFIALIGLPIIIMLIGIANYRLKRLWSFLSPSNDRLGINYQITESVNGFIKGGFVGVGLGKGTKNIPEPFTDFIYSIFGEEMGFLGAFFILLIFVLLAIRGFKIAFKCQDKFLMLLSFGFTFLIISQTLINIMVSLGLVPTTGITLPFISYGRSSLIISSISIGIILNISRKITNERNESVI